MGELTSNIIIIIVISAILGFAISYIVKAKKKGVKCIGCPDGASCSKSSCNSGETNTATPDVNTISSNNCSCNNGSCSDTNTGCGGSCGCKRD